MIKTRAGPGVGGGRSLRGRHRGGRRPWPRAGWPRWPGQGRPPAFPGRRDLGRRL